MERYYVWSKDILGTIYLNEFKNRSEAEAYAEATEQNFYLSIDRTVEIKELTIEKAVTDYLVKKTKHIKVIPITTGGNNE